MRAVVLCILCTVVFTVAADCTAGEVERREIGNLVIEGIPEIPERIKERMLQYQNTRSASFSGWDNKGTGIFISTRFGETSQIHYISKPGGARKQLTFFKEPIRRAAVCPDPARRGFLFGKDIGGSEFYQIFYFNLDKGTHAMLTDGTSRNGAFRWSNSGDRFIYYSTKRNGRDWDLYVSTIENPSAAEAVVTEGGFWFPGEWSPDDKRLIVGRYVSANESYGYILDIATKKLKEISPTEEKVSYGGAVWAKNGKGVFFSSDQESEFKHLRYYDLEKKKGRIITDEIHWDVEEFEIDDGGDLVAFTVNEDGINKLYLLDTKSYEYRQVPGIPIGQIYQLEFNPDGKRLAFVINTPQTPGDVYVLDVGDHSIERWTYSEVGGLDTDAFVVPGLIHYETFDEVDGKPRMIPAFYYKPERGEPPYPVLIDIHGGPEGQELPYFSAFTQYAVCEHSIAVIAPNVRGSSGYGKSYLKLDNGRKREDSVWDIGKLLDWIETRPELDASRVAVFGGSYGGYMVLASMTHYSDRLKAGIDIVGISSFVTFLENTKEYRRDLRRVEYGDERDPEMRAFLTEISPLTNAHKIKKPMLIVQGLNDPRVPVGESEQIVEAVRKNDVDVWYLLAKDEGHGFSKKSNRDYFVNAAVLFLEKHLLQ
ncbi:MAG: S9 family peptidase [bacterium]|nr:MAG: S9 family peptidase [bacterium]